MITRPLLAATVEDISQLRYPLLATPKIDGIRCLVIDGCALSRTFKPIQNKFIRHELGENAKYGLNNLDGELIVGNNFQETSSGVMSFEGEPNFKYLVFDSLENAEANYMSRLFTLRGLSAPPYYEFLFPTEVRNTEQVENLLNYYLSKGHEGIMLRDPNGIYKCGRSTLKEGILLKLKPFCDREATIVGFIEKFFNESRVTSDNFGLAKRSHRQEDMMPADTLGALRVYDPLYGDFNVGSGFDDRTRKEIWNNQAKYIGKKITYKYQKHGMKDKPRSPVFLRMHNEL